MLARDLVSDLGAGNGYTADKPEGVAIDVDGRLFVVTDHDGVDHSIGGTRFIRLILDADS